MRRFLVIFCFFLSIVASSSDAQKRRAVRSGPPFRYQAAIDVHEMSPGIYNAWGHTFNHLSSGDVIETWVLGSDGNEYNHRTSPISISGGPWQGQIFEGPFPEEWPPGFVVFIQVNTIKGRRYVVESSVPFKLAGFSLQQGPLIDAVIDEEGGMLLIGDFKTPPVVVIPFWLNIALPVQDGNYVPPGSWDWVEPMLVGGCSGKDGNTEHLECSSIILPANKKVN